MSVERKYQLTRLGKGDYLLPSNDAQTLFRIHAYDEDGSAYWVDADNKQHPIKGQRWAVWRHRLPLPQVDLGQTLWEEEDDPGSWNAHWVESSFGWNTRAQAIEEALT